jgi:hypothetical protein
MSETKDRKHWFRFSIGELVIVCFLLSFICIGCFVWNFQAPPVSLAVIKGLPKGATTKEVLKQFGPPKYAYEEMLNDGSNGSVWVYARSLSWPILYIYFDADGKYSYFVYDPF